MPQAEKFWVLPCKENPRGWVIYTEETFEILVEVDEGMIVYQSTPLTEAQMEYFKKNVLTKN